MEDAPAGNISDEVPPQRVPLWGAVRSSKGARGSEHQQIGGGSRHIEYARRSHGRYGRPRGAPEVREDALAENMPNHPPLDLHGGYYITIHTQPPKGCAKLPMV